MTLDQRTITFSIIQWTRRFLKHNNKHTIGDIFIYVIQQQQQQRRNRTHKREKKCRKKIKGRPKLTKKKVTLVNRKESNFSE